MTRRMFDGIDSGDAAIARQAKPGDLAAGYVDGRYKWSDAQWSALASGVTRVRIAVFASTNDGDFLDSVLFDTASNWIARLVGAHQAGRLDQELKKVRRYRLIIIDEVGYIPFGQDAANLFFQLVASRYELGSIMVASNLPFGRWGETFSDDVVTAAMIDRLVHHA